MIHHIMMHIQHKVTPRIIQNIGAHFFGKASNNHRHGTQYTGNVHPVDLIDFCHVKRLSF
jgi:hypothetical protein